MNIKSLHHVAIICSDYKKSKQFYTEVLGFDIIKEAYREEKQSFKLDLALHDKYLIELFSFPSPPKRLSYPEACGMRHLAFEVEHLNSSINYLVNKGINCEPVRIDEYTGKRFVFFNDPDGLPIELYES